MATYKVLQDIEAEDKLLGPFTLKQFIFAGITIVIGFIAFQILMSGAPVFIMVPMLVVLLPPFLLFGFLAAPIGRDQTSETWLLARLRFLFKPRIRIWSQDGLSELVTITVPKKTEHVYTKNFTQDEVKSRLQALANTVDSRGWAVKNINTNLFNQPSYIQNNAGISDRLVDPSTIPQDVPAVDILASDDILDPVNNPTAQHFDQMIQNSSAQIRQQALENMSANAKLANSAPVPPPKSEQPPTDYYFMHENNVDSSKTPSEYANFTSQHVVTPGSNQPVQVQETPEELALARKIAEEEKERKEFMTNHGNVIQPIQNQVSDTVQIDTPTTPQQPLKQNTSNTRQEAVDPDIIKLAYRDDYYIDTTARQAQKIKESKMPNKSSDGEVVISLH